MTSIKRSVIPNLFRDFIKKATQILENLYDEILKQVQYDKYRAMSSRIHFGILSAYINYAGCTVREPAETRMKVKTTGHLLNDEVLKVITSKRSGFGKSQTLI